VATPTPKLDRNEWLSPYLAAALSPFSSAMINRLAREGKLRYIVSGEGVKGRQRIKVSASDLRRLLAEAERR
jgi:hypothetical protein